MNALSSSTTLVRQAAAEGCAALPEAWKQVAEIQAPRKILLVMPRFPTTFWGLDYAFQDIISGPRYPLPPLSLTTLAAFLPRAWEVRIVDENVRPVADSELAWCDVLMMNAMIVQAVSVRELTERAHRLEKVVAVGGPNPTISPEHYPEADYIHRGEMGDASVDFFLRLAKNKARPAGQEIFAVLEKVPMQAYPTPRHDLIRASDYLSLSLQFAVGCPFNCEFCDIIEIYGRIPRVKRPEQVLQELNGLYATGHRGSVFFVDDNFIGNLPKVKALLPEIVRWQEQHGFPFQFYTEASVNLAEHPGLLVEMRRAGFYAVFLGVETPDPQDLKVLQKPQNARRPLLESLRVLQDHGLEIWAGLIMGLDTDRPETAGRIVEFVEESAITMAMVNLLNAPTGTQLWRRLKAEGRLLDRLPIGDNVTDTNVVFRQDHTTVLRWFREVWERLYDPTLCLRRVRRNLERTAVNSARLGKLVSWKVKLRSMPHLLWQMGVRARYRREFWKLLFWSLRRGAVDAFTFQMGMIYHCLRFRDQVLERLDLELKLGRTKSSVAIKSDLF